MLIRYLPILSLILLASCANIRNKQIQDVEVRTPGAQESVCFLLVDKVRYKVNPPQVINIPRSERDMIVECQAAGNRSQKQVIKSTIGTAVFGNVATGILPGLGWDYFSDSMYKYPDLIVVDFTNARTYPEKLPAQNAPDIKQPEEYPLEEILPGRPRLNSDRFEVPVELTRRQKGGSAVSSEGPHIIETGGSSGDKGNLHAVNPAGPPTPISTVPGQ